MTYTDFPRYLASKKSVDDRALNRHVWDTLRDHLARRASAKPPRILEIGAGIGTMVERVFEWGLVEKAHYTALDEQHDNIESAKQRLTAINAPTSQLCLETIDLFDFMAREKGKSRWDLLIAHAFLDLMDIPATLPPLFELIAPGGLFYFTINFDGVTILEPTIDPDFDELVQTLYHRTMDERITDGKRSGDSRAGRHLYHAVTRAGGSVLAMGASDWVVIPQNGRYPHDEAWFLHFIIDTMAGALAGHPELDGDRFRAWIEKRHKQVDSAELVYIAHQTDLVGIVK